MQIVLGVSMTPAAVRMVLVEGRNGDGVTVDTGVFRGPRDVVGQVVAAIGGTRDSAAEGGHQLLATGVAWTDHGQAARLRDALRAHGIDDVVMVSELHAAGALAQAIGATTGTERTALLFLEQDIATLAVVRTADGAVVGVRSHSLHTTDAVAELQGMVALLEGTDEPPQAVFVVGSGVDVAAVAAQVSECTSLPVHAPDDADLALARGAALASAATPRYEAATVGIASTAGALTDDALTAAGVTQPGYLGPLGYSALADDADDDDHLDAVGVADGDPSAADAGASDQRSFMLVGSALATVFVVGVVSLVISLAVSIRPAVEQRPDTGDNVSSVPAPQSSSSAPQTIEAPVPVVQQAPRTVFARPGAPVPAAPPPVAVPAAPPPVAVPAAPPPVAVSAAPPVFPAPAPVIPPVVLSPILPALLPPVFQPPVRSAPLPRYPSTTSVPTYPTPSPPTSSPPTSSPPTTSPPTTSPPPSVIPTTTPPSSATSAPTPSQTDSAGTAGSGDSDEPVVTAPAATTPVWPVVPGLGDRADSA